MRTLFLVGFLAGCPAVPTSTDSAADAGAVDADGDGTPAATD